MPKSGNFSPAFLGSLTPATTLEFVSILNGLKTRDSTEKEIDEMINVLKERWSEKLKER